MQFDSVGFLASVGAHLSIMLGLATGHRTHPEASVFLGRRVNGFETSSHDLEPTRSRGRKSVSNVWGQ